ncbi:guanine nucleotide exchange protein for ADP-robosylation factor, partial [Kappamyces sp. JEL0829]
MRDANVVPKLEEYEAIFKPFMLAIQEKKNAAVLLSLELLAKLFEYGYWNMSVSGIQGLIGLVTETVANCFAGETTDEKIQMQVLRALAAAISVNDNLSCLHGSQLLKSVRVIYNIFLLSRSPGVQTIAQATLTQITTSIFSRVPEVYSYKEIMKNHRDKVASKSGSTSDKAVSMQRSSSGILQDNDKELGEFDEPANLSLAISILAERNPTARDSQDLLKDVEDRQETAFDVIAKDAYLLFRAYCKLAMKPIPDSGTDLKSQHMRSKILSLSLVMESLKTYKHVFSFPCPILFTRQVQATSEDDVKFIIATKQYLCMVITRNIFNIVPQVFDLSMDIFGRVMIDLRYLMKKEIAVLFTQMILPIIEASTPVTFYQRVSCIRSLQRTLSRPEGGSLLVELYLNYDCDPSSGPEENIWERLTSVLAQVSTGSTLPSLSEGGAGPQFNFNNDTFSIGAGPAITTSNLQNYTKEQVKQLYLPTGDMTELKKQVTNLMVKGVLAPLHNFCKDQLMLEKSRTPKESSELDLMDDQVTTFEISKNKKVRLAEGIKMFNQKPKKAIRFLVESKVIPSKAPRHVAHFLRNCPGLDKTMIGEYLGEGDEANVQTMHSFVDMMDFTGLSFVDAMRTFLNTFRLPGEAQKIDRFMLKFAERYVCGNPSTFSSADTAYVLAYSTIMLNTDQHNPQVKKRMTCEDFVKNNRGIDEGKDLPASLLEAIFDDIKSNEIKLKDERLNTSQNGSTEAPLAKVKGYAKPHHASAKSMQSDLYSEIRKNHGTTRDPTTLDPAFKGLDVDTTFVKAVQHGHVKPMFQLGWMSFLMTVSATLQNCDDLDTIITSLEGFKYAIHISCLFDLELERKGFLANLSKFLDVPNLIDVKEKNIEACKMLLEIAHIDGNSFNDNWTTVVKCISQLEKIQTGGIIEADPTRNAEQRRKDTRHIEEMFANLSSQSVTLSIDRIFSGSSKLNAAAIGYFVRALCEMSWDEIISS